MTLKDGIKNTFLNGISKVYHHSVFTIGLVAIYILTLLKTDNNHKRDPYKVPIDLSQEFKDNRSEKKVQNISSTN